MADAAAVPKQAGKGLASAFKKIPVWGWVLIGSAFLILLMIQRRKAAASAAADAAGQNATTDPNAVDPSQYGADTTGQDQAYLSGYDSGLYANTGNLPTDVFGGIGSGGVGGTSSGNLPSGAPNDGTGTGPGPGSPIDIHPVFNFPAGGGAPNRPAVHGTPPPTKKKTGCGTKPKARPKKGYTWQCKSGHWQQVRTAPVKKKKKGEPED